MAYTEIKERNKKKYYYRVLSIRKDGKVKKKRIYLGANLSKKILLKKEGESDIQLEGLKRKKENKILKKIISQIKKILYEENIKKAGIFGSYALGEQKKNSDIDILIEPPKGIGIKFANIGFKLEKKLKIRVDVLTYKSLHPLLKERILNEEIRIE